MKKLAAGAAALAALAGSMAVGAASAYAADNVVNDNATFTFTADDAAQLTDRALAVYKIADYVKYGDGAAATYGVRTAAGNKNAVDAALGKALGADYGKKNADNLAKALADGKLDQSPDRPWATGSSRKFADELKALAGTMSAVNPAPKLAINGKTGTLQLPAGMYLVSDDTKATAAVTQAVPMIVASGKVADGVLREPTAGATVNFKNTRNTPHTKTVKQSTTSLGDVLDYTIKGKVANPAPDSFVFTDQPGVGLSVKADSFTATADGKAIAFADYFATDLKALKNGTDGDGNAMFTITLKSGKIAELAGKSIEVSYKALVNAEAKGTDKVVNKVLKNDGDPDQKFHEVSTKLLKFDFTKVDNDGAGIEGATFKLSVAQGQTGSLPAQGGPAVEAVSGKDGKVSFADLKAGTYTVTETKVANGKYQDIKAAFTIDLKEDGTYTIAKTAASDPFNLVDAAKKTVLNVRNIAELPLTGAAGTIMFTVVALLLGAAGVVVVVKSRSVKNAMTA